MKSVDVHDIEQIKNLLTEVFGSCSYLHIERLGGMTNHTYKVDLTEGRTYVIRIPGEGTEKLINRANERVSTQLACALGIDSPMVYFGERGEKVTHYISGAKTMDPVALRRNNIMKKATDVLRTLHTSQQTTGVPFDVFDMADSYENIIRENAVPLFDDFSEVKQRIIRIRQYVDSHAPCENVPCHNDPLCENWVLSGSGSLFLIDWEYAGMNDCMWDLADLSIEVGLTQEEDDTLLFFYFGRNPTWQESIRFFANKLYLDFLWALWGKARVPYDGVPMDKYGLERYRRLQNNLDKFGSFFPISDNT